MTKHFDMEVEMANLLATFQYLNITIINYDKIYVQIDFVDYKFKSNSS